MGINLFKFYILFKLFVLKFCYLSLTEFIYIFYAKFHNYISNFYFICVDITYIVL